MKAELFEKLSIDPPNEELTPPVVMRLLDEVGEWDTTYFKVDFEEVGRRTLAIASCTLVIRAEKSEITRKGTVSLIVDDDSIQRSDLSKALMDLCICDAAKKLGKRFGRDNDVVFKRQIEIPKHKPKPNAIIISQYLNANSDQDDKEMERIESNYDMSDVLRPELKPKTNKNVRSKKNS